MRLLLDTHIWIWSALDPARIRERVAAELENPSNQIWLSPISVWETLTLARKGRISLEPDPVTWVRHALRKKPLFREASFNHEVGVESHRVELPHWDPADRILAATALVHDLTLVTADERLLALKSIALLANR